MAIQPHELLCAHFLLYDDTDLERANKTIKLYVGHSEKDYADVLENLDNKFKDGYKLVPGSILWTKTPGVYAELECFMSSYFWELHKCPSLEEYQMTKVD